MNTRYGLDEIKSIENRDNHFISAHIYLSKTDRARRTYILICKEWMAALKDHQMTKVVDLAGMLKRHKIPFYMVTQQPNTAIIIPPLMGCFSQNVSGDMDGVMLFRKILYVDQFIPIYGEFRNCQPDEPD